MEWRLDADTVTSFMATGWRREARCFAGAFTDTEGLVEGDELAGLACEEGVDARIVVGDDARGDWRAESGPFEEERFATLPPSGWTLLVQSVDLLDRQVAGLLEPFDFLPRWSLDDIMVSWSAAGGGVGPHFDHYDVFLVQTAGRRRWRVGQWCTDDSPLESNPSLRLLADFEASAQFDLGPGDMLYVPAGLAHWGTALDDGCVTCSVGFRAPSVGELLMLAAERLASDASPGRRVRPHGSRPGDGYRIGADIETDLGTVWPVPDAEQVRDALLDAFGTLVTERRAVMDELLDHQGNGGALADLTGGDRGATSAGFPPIRCQHAVGARFAWRETGDAARLFVNGETHHVSADLAAAVCNAPFVMSAVATMPGAPALIGALLETGALVTLD